jgi:hypothetical protein
MRFALPVLTAAFLLSAALVAQSSATNPPPQQREAPPQAAGKVVADLPPPNPEDVKSIESILGALYSVISGPAGERDWNRFRSLFLPEARLTSATEDKNGTVKVHPHSVEDYVQLAGEYFAKNGFYESPLVSRVQRFGNVAQVFSSYASRKTSGEAPFSRGINSIQLLYDGHRWWIVSILWDEERRGNPLPRGFAGKNTRQR